jgi:hypothetical protein
MDQADFEKEKDYIFDCGRVNGFSNELIMKIFKIHERKKNRSEITTLEEI